MARRRQIINPLTRFRQKSIGPYANRIKERKYARGMGPTDTRCFFVASATIGDDGSQADLLTITFSADADASCNIAGDWSFDINGAPAFQATKIGLSGNRLFWQLRKDEAQGVGNQDTVTYSYVPGTCRKEGSDAGDCDLEAITDEVVDNQVFGPNAVRVGDLDDQTVVAFMNADVAVLGDVWTVRVNGNPVTINTIEYGVQPNRIRFILASAVTSTDVLTLTHAVGPGTECASVDGRECWDFFNLPVENVIDITFWTRQDAGAWLVEDTGRWQLEG